MLAVSNGVNSVSRVLTGYAGDKCGRQNTLILTVLLCVISVLGFWLGSTGSGGNKSLWILFVVFYGIAGGGYNALFPTVSRSLDKQVESALLTYSDYCRSLRTPGVC